MQVSNSKTSFQSAILLVKSEAHASVERNALRSVGLRNIRIISSGLDYLKEQIEKTKNQEISEIIFCHEELKDMTSFEFMNIFFKHPFLQTIPVIAILDSDVDKPIEYLKSHNFSGLLARPYTQDKLQSQLIFAQKIQAARLKIFNQQNDYSLNPFFEELNNFITNHREEEIRPERALVQGISELKAKKYNDAIYLLDRASESKLCSGDANYALAFAWRGKKNIARSKDYFELACLSYFELESWDKFKKACLGYSSISQDKSFALTELAIALLQNENFALPLKAIKSEAILFDLDKISNEIHSFAPDHMDQIIKYIKQHEITALLVYFEDNHKTSTIRLLRAKFFKKQAKKETFQDVFTLADEDSSLLISEDILAKSQVTDLEISGLIKDIIPVIEAEKGKKIVKEKTREKDEIGKLVEILLPDESFIPERKISFGQAGKVIQPMEEEIPQNPISDIIQGIKKTHKLHKDSLNKYEK